MIDHSSTSGYVPRLDQRRFDELMLYLAERSAEDIDFGDTKLNKLLAFSDFLAYARLGHSVTGAEYQRQPYGPLARPLLPSRRRLQAAGDLRVVETREGSRTRRRTAAQRTADTSVFSSEELKLVDEVIAMMRPHNAVSISTLSHRYIAGWSLVDDGDTIPYETIFIETEPASAATLQRARELAAQHGWSR
jgi:hypothetical protein